MAEFIPGLTFIEKDNEIFKRLELLNWIKTKLEIKRFDANKILLMDDETIKFVIESPKIYYRV